MPRHTDSKERLVAVASELIWKRSYYGTSVDMICEACGIKKGSFYHHFESKEQLMGTALDAQWGHFKGMLDTCFSVSLSPLERFRSYARASYAAQEACYKASGTVLGCPLYALGTEIGTQEPMLREKIDLHLSVMARYFTAAVRDGVAEGSLKPCDPAQVAEQLMSYCEGALTLARIQNNLGPIRALEDGILRFLS
jgi:TetR/AcrR family transcriptional repressor of nem operon